MRYKILFLFITIGAVFQLAAQGRVKLTGRVYDSDNQPIELATVRVAGTTMGTMTDLKGEYQLSIPAGDSIVVIYSCLGYREERRQLLNLTKDVSLSVRLNKNAKMLNEVVVATHRRQTSTLQTIDTKDLKLMPDATGGSIEAMLTTFAGVNSSNELSSQYSVRGGNFDENIVYINGIEVYRPLTVRSGQQEGLSIINPDMVGAVGFSSGGFSAEYGDKMSSVLDIIYKHPEAFEGSVSASFLGATASVGQSTKKFSQLHGVRYKTNSTLLSSLDTKGEYEPSFFDYQTYLTYKFAPKWEASLLGNISINNYKFTPHERNTSFGTATDAKQFKVYFDGYEKDKFETYFGAFSLNFFPDKYTQWALMTSAFVTNELVTYDIAGQYWLDDLALLSDAGHNLSDVVSLVLAMFALRLSMVKPSLQYTYGYKKSTVLVSLLNAAILFVAVAVILYESIEKFSNPTPLDGGAIAWVAAIGIVINAFTAYLFFADKSKDLNVKGAYLHMAADTLVSVGVLVSGIVIKYTGWNVIDPIIGIVVGLVILYSTWHLLQESLRLALDGVPEGIDVQKVETVLSSDPDVLNVHHLHIWAISTTQTALTAHIVVKDITHMHEVKHRLKHDLQDLGIEHATLELELKEEHCDRHCDCCEEQQGCDSDTQPYL